MKTLSSCLLVLFLFSSISSHANGAKQLHIIWPLDWFVTDVSRKDNVMVLRGEQMDSQGEISQVLRLTAINAAEASNPIQKTDVRHLVQSLAGNQKPQSGEIVLNEFKNSSGFYFVMPESEDHSLAILEGIILKNNYIINVTMISKAMESSQSHEILMAIDKMDIH